MDAGRIDVNVSVARMANAIASQSVAESVGPPVSASTGAAPGMFAVVSAATSTVNADAVAARAGLAAHLTVLDECNGEAATAYEVANEQNRHSLMVAQE